MPAVATPVEDEMPGFYRLEFNLSPDLLGAGDQPIVVILTSGQTSRLDDTAPRIFIF
jgi:hypothetical protein